MSFLSSLGPAAPAASATSNPLASGLANMLGTTSDHISDIAGRIGQGMNSIAKAGGASEGYNPAPAMPMQNHLQMLDPGTIQAIIAKFGGARPGQMQPQGYAQ